MFPYITVAVADIDATSHDLYALFMWAARGNPDVLYADFHCDKDFHVRLFVVRRNYAATPALAAAYCAEYNSYTESLLTHSGV